MTFPKSSIRDYHPGDRIFHFLIKSVAVMSLGILVFMVLAIGSMSWPAFREFGFHFFIIDDWNPVTGLFGALPFIYGTLISSFIALFFSVPISIGMALYVNEIAPEWLARPLGFLVEMLAAIPSIVYGLWGLFVMVPFLKTYIQPPLSKYLGFIPLFEGPPLGVGMLAAGVLLAFMVTPTISTICREIFNTVPHRMREAAYALGATRWEMLKLAVFRASVPGVLAATMLGLGRALGETMAVTMVIGNVSQIKTSVFEPAQTMASLIANEYAEADTDLQLASLTAVGLTLFFVSLFVNGCARFVIWKNRHKYRI